MWYYSVQAQSECDVIFIPKGRIIGECANLCQCHRRLIENFLTILSERNLYLDKKIEYFAIKSVTGKICAYLYDQYKLNGGPLFTSLTATSWRTFSMCQAHAVKGACQA